MTKIRSTVLIALAAFGLEEHSRPVPWKTRELPNELRQILKCSVVSSPKSLPWNWSHYLCISMPPIEPETLMRWSKIHLAWHRGFQPTEDLNGVKWISPGSRSMMSLVPLKAAQTAIIGTATNDGIWWVHSNTYYQCQWSVPKKSFFFSKGSCLC